MFVNTSQGGERLPAYQHTLHGLKQVFKELFFKSNIDLCYFITMTDGWDSALCLYLCMSLAPVDVDVMFLRVDVRHSFRVASQVVPFRVLALDWRKCSRASQADWTCRHMWAHFSLNESFMSRLKYLTREMAKEKKKKESWSVDNNGFYAVMLSIHYHYLCRVKTL